MIIVKLIEFLKSHQKLVLRVCIAFLAMLIAVDAIPGLIDKEHAHSGAEHIPGFWSLFGLACCLIVVFLSKGYGKLGISTREDYYDA